MRFGFLDMAIAGAAAVVFFMAGQASANDADKGKVNDSEAKPLVQWVLAQ